MQSPDEMVEGEKFDEKNIRRRVYDALNVLMAMNIIAKEKKARERPHPFSLTPYPFGLLCFWLALHLALLFSCAFARCSRACALAGSRWAKRRGVRADLRAPARAGHHLEGPPEHGGEQLGAAARGEAALRDAHREEEGVPAGAVRAAHRHAEPAAAQRRTHLHRGVRPRLHYILPECSTRYTPLYTIHYTPPYTRAKNVISPMFQLKISDINGAIEAGSHIQS